MVMRKACKRLGRMVTFEAHSFTVFGRQPFFKCSSRRKPQTHVTIFINDVRFKAQIDPRADVNVINEGTYNNLKKQGNSKAN